MNEVQDVAKPQSEKVTVRKPVLSYGNSQDENTKAQSDWKAMSDYQAIEAQVTLAPDIEGMVTIPQDAKISILSGDTFNKGTGNLTKWKLCFIEVVFEGKPTRMGIKDPESGTKMRGTTVSGKTRLLPSGNVILEQQFAAAKPEIAPIGANMEG